MARHSSAKAVTLVRVQSTPRYVIMKKQINDYIKTYKKLSREEEIKQHNRSINYYKVYKSNKIYKQIKKIVLEND